MQHQPLDLHLLPHRYLVVNLNPLPFSLQLPQILVVVQYLEHLLQLVQLLPQLLVLVQHLEHLLQLLLLLVINLLKPRYLEVKHLLRLQFLVQALQSLVHLLGQSQLVLHRYLEVQL